MATEQRFKVGEAGFCVVSIMLIQLLNILELCFLLLLQCLQIPSEPLRCA